MHESQRHRQDQEGKERLPAVEPERGLPQQAAAQVAEELAVEESEENREGRAGAGHLRNCPRKSTLPGTPSQDERQYGQEDAVAHVAKDEPEEHREEDGHERSGIQAAVTRQWQKTDQRFEGPEYARIGKDYRRFGSGPLLARELFHDQCVRELLGQSPNEPRVVVGGNPALDHEGVRREAGQGQGLQPVQPVVQVVAGPGQLPAVLPADREHFAVQPVEPGTDFPKPLQHLRNGLGQRLSGKARRYRHFLDPRFGKDLFEPRRRRFPETQQYGQFASGQRLASQFKNRTGQGSQGIAQLLDGPFLGVAEHKTVLQGVGGLGLALEERLEDCEDIAVLQEIVTLLPECRALSCERA